MVDEDGRLIAARALSRNAANAARVEAASKRLDQALEQCPDGVVIRELDSEDSLVTSTEAIIEHERVRRTTGGR